MISIHDSLIERHLHDYQCIIIDIHWFTKIDKIDFDLVSLVKILLSFNETLLVLHYCCTHYR